jgi:CRISPR/Cas system CMR-associated protein Cmr1 (group 7 of RAMP superfamily)
MDKIEIKKLEVGDSLNWLNAKAELILRVNGKDIVAKGTLRDLYLSEREFLPILAQITGFSEQYLNKILINSYNKKKKKVVGNVSKIADAF